MIFVRYDRKRLILAALAMLGLAFASSAGAGASGSLIADTFATLMFVTFICAASRLGYLAAGDLAALKEQGDALKVTGFWRARRIAWRSFSGATEGGVKLLWLPLPFLSFDHLILRRIETGVFGGETKLPLLLTNFPRDRIAALADQLDSLAIERGRSLEKAPAPGPAVSGGFDPDAAIARYLSRNQDDETREAAAPPRVIATPRPPVAARPAFGRKGI